MFSQASNSETVLSPKRVTDIPFAILWLSITFGFFILGLLHLKLPTHDSSGPTPGPNPNPNPIPARENPFTIFKKGGFYAQLLVAIVLGFGLVAGFLKILKKNAEAVVNTCVYFGWAVFFGLGCLFLMVAYPMAKHAPKGSANEIISFIGIGAAIVSFTCMLGAALTAMLACCCWRDQVKITAALLNCAAQVFEERLITALILPVFSGLLGFVFWMVWLCSSHGFLQLAGWDPYGIEHHPTKKAAEDAKTPNILACCFCVFVACWGFGVLTNTVHVAYCKMVGCWYYLTSMEYSEKVAPVRFYLHAWSFHLGSICFGSFIVAVISTLKYLAQTLEDREESNSRREGNNGSDVARIIKVILLNIIICLLSLVESIAEFINRIAYVNVGVRNQGFIESAKSIMHTFGNSEGLRLLINNTLVTSVLRVVMFCFLFLSLLIVWLSGKIFFMGTDTSPTSPDLGPAPILFGFLLCLAACLLTTGDSLGMIDSGVFAIFVLYAEDSAKIREHNLVLFNELEGKRQHWSRQEQERQRSVPMRGRENFGGGYSTYA